MSGIVARTARFRVRALRKIQRLLVGPVGAGIPGRGWARSVIERLNEPRLAHHVVQTWTRTAATIEHYDFPPSFPPYFRRTKAFDDRHAYRLRDVLVSPHSGLVWLPDGPVLAESYGSLIRMLGWGDARADLLKHAEVLSRSVIPFPGMPYYHWLLEILPSALFSTSVSPQSALLLPLGSPKYAIDGAKRIAPGRIIAVPGVCRVDECIVAAREPLPGFVKRVEIERIRDFFSVDRRDAEGPRRLYVSRRRDPARALANESDVEKAMHEQGITIVYPQDLSFEAQIHLFASVELVVAPHGAGLANLVWGDRLRRVVEIFPATYFNDCYARLSRMLDADYRYVVSSPDPTSAGLVPIKQLLSMIRLYS
jgi:capsular polysaccharide biosynthesis protein